jgi:hypothetical protein
MNEPKTIVEWKTAYLILENKYTDLVIKHQHVMNFLLDLWLEKSTRIFRVSTVATIINLLLGESKN